MIFLNLILIVVCALILGATANWAIDVLPGWQNRPRGGRFDIRRVPHYSTLLWYLWRGGICPHCGNERPKWLPVLELSLVVLFTFSAYLIRDELMLLLLIWLYSTFLLIVLVIDYKHRRVLNIMLGPAAIIIFLLSFLPVTPEPLNALLGGVVGFGLFLLLALVGRGAMGAGDVKLAGVIGLMTGFPGVLTALIIGVLLAAIVAVFLLVSKRAGRKSTMAYAPYLSLGALIALLNMLVG